MSWPFGWLFFWAEPDMRMTYQKVGPRLIKGDDERPSAMLNGTELAQ
jgi:hypothetical protein